jgi:hypothetical protein
MHLSKNAMREKLPLLATVLGVTLSVISAFAMRDHVRTVDIVTLFFGGAAAGAGLAGLLGKQHGAETQFHSRRHEL